MTFCAIFAKRIRMGIFLNLEDIYECIMYEAGSQAHCSLGPSLVVLYGLRPQAHWALGLDLVVQYMTLSSLHLWP